MTKMQKPRKLLPVSAFSLMDQHCYAHDLLRPTKQAAILLSWLACLQKSLSPAYVEQLLTDLMQLSEFIFRFCACPTKIWPWPSAFGGLHKMYGLLKKWEYLAGFCFCLADSDSAASLHWLAIPLNKPEVISSCFLKDPALAACPLLPKSRQQLNFGMKVFITLGVIVSYQIYWKAAFLAQVIMTCQWKYVSRNQSTCLFPARAMNSLARGLARER